MIFLADSLVHLGPGGRGNSFFADSLVRLGSGGHFWQTLWCTEDLGEEPYFGRLFGAFRTGVWESYRSP